MKRPRLFWVYVGFYALIIAVAGGFYLSGTRRHAAQEAAALTGRLASDRAVLEKRQVWFTEAQGLEDAARKGDVAGFEAAEHKLAQLASAKVCSAETATALDYAARSGKTQILAYSLDHGYLSRDDHQQLARLLSSASFFCTAASMRFLLKTGADPNGTPKEAGSPLLDIMLSRSDPGIQLEMAQQLLRAGADPNLRYRDDSQNLSKDRGLNPAGYTPLMVAALHNDVPMANLLLQAHADASLRNPIGQTAGDIAAKSGHRLLAQQLRAAQKQPVP